MNSPPTRLPLLSKALGLDVVEEAHRLPLALPGDDEVAVAVHGDRGQGLVVGRGGVHPKLVALRDDALNVRVGRAVGVVVGLERYLGRRHASSRRRDAGERALDQRDQRAGVPDLTYLRNPNRRYDKQICSLQPSSFFYLTLAHPHHIT